MKKLNAKIILSMIIGIMVFSSISNAAVRTWTGVVSSNWSDPANWAEGIIPGSDDDVVISLADPFRDCLLNISTTIKSLRIEVTYGSEFTLPVGNILSITGDIYIDAPFMPWGNTSNIVLTGIGDQSITVIDPFGDFFFYDLTINKSSGTVILESDITITHVFSNLSGTIIDYNGHTIIGGCTPPQTGGIYHIANDFAL